MWLITQRLQDGTKINELNNTFVIHVVMHVAHAGIFLAPLSSCITSERLAGDAC